MASTSKGNPNFLPPSVRLQEQLRTSKDELKLVNEEIKKLQSRQRELNKKISSLKSGLELISGSADAQVEFDRENFSWSAELRSKMNSVFNIQEYRSHQRAAINATMSKLDCVLIMPTGGGKSLCFQLPAILSVGVTLVVSPLISLMEDQLQSLQTLQIPTSIFNAQTKREESKEIFRRMVDPNSDLKLLYVTPEKLAKSKTLMSQLEKMYRAGRFARLVIDEVHCCSQWGHDFRPDYKFLGIMKNQYPDTPIIGLTATATATVIVDVQKILNIEGSLLFKDSFFRANLKYEVQDTPNKDKADDIAELIKTRFPKQSGIIYCLTIKDTEDVAQRMKELGVSAERYHAQLEPEDRTKIQRNWYSGRIHVIVATVAFGMGINKLNVRYVIHHSMSKSVENYYQETGRAGRDGDPAWCILYYRFLDTFRASSLMFTEKNGVHNVHNMLLYSLNRKSCRKALLAKHFGDAWELEGCGEMCDNCERASNPNAHFEEINVEPLLKDILKLLDQANLANERMTGLKLMDAWFGKGNKKNRHEEVFVPKYSRHICETIMAHLLTDGYLKEEFHFTPYSTISYIVRGPAGRGSDGIPIFYSILTKSGVSFTYSTTSKVKPKSTTYPPLPVKTKTTSPVTTSTAQNCKSVISISDSDSDDFNKSTTQSTLKTKTIPSAATTASVKHQNPQNGISMKRKSKSESEISKSISDNSMSKSKPKPKFNFKKGSNSTAAATASTTSKVKIEESSDKISFSRAKQPSYEGPAKKSKRIVTSSDEDELIDLD